jgi:hypothetical protein
LSSSRPEPLRRRLAGISGLERRLLPRAFLTVLLVRLSLRRSGYQRTCQRFAGTERTPRPDAEARVAASVRMVDLVTARLPVDTACLPRSVALWSLLRRQGVASQIVIGVRPGGAPLDAHAWVERNGQPINETPERVATFARLEPGPR